MKYRQIHFQGMGSFNWFKIAAWKKINRNRAINHARKLVEKIAECGYPDHSAILWLSSGKVYHRNLNNKTPWKSSITIHGRKFDFDSWNKRFFELYQIWLDIHKEFHLKFVPILMMRDNYCWYPFHNNINGVSGIHSVDGLWHIYRYMHKIISMHIDVFGKAPSIIPYNEPAHYGNALKYHDIMYEHEDVWKQILKPLGGSLKNMWVDMTMCEAVAGELMEYHECSKPEGCDRGGWHGDDANGRRVLGIKHNFTTLGDFMMKLSSGVTRLQNMVQSGNHWRLYTEDGGGTVNDGNYQAGPFNIRVGDADQQYEMMKVLIQTYKDTGFKAIFGTFPHKALKYKKIRRLFKPDYRVKNIDWDRIENGIVRACKEMKR